MTEDDKQDPTSAPGSSAGDAAPTQQIPRIPKPVSRPAKKTPRQPTGQEPAAQRRAHRPTRAVRRTIVPPAGRRVRVVRRRRPTTADGTSSDRRPLTAADYARTTKPSPSTTAVIPAVKDKVDEGSRSNSAKTKSGATLAPSPKPSSKKERRASLRLTHVEPWSVTRLAFAISVAMMIVRSSRCRSSGSSWKPPGSGTRSMAASPRC